ALAGALFHVHGHPYSRQNPPSLSVRTSYVLQDDRASANAHRCDIEAALLSDPWPPFLAPHGGWARCELLNRLGPGDEDPPGRGGRRADPAATGANDRNAAVCDQSHRGRRLRRPLRLPAGANRRGARPAPHRGLRAQVQVAAPVAVQLAMTGTGSKGTLRVPWRRAAKPARSAMVLRQWLRPSRKNLGGRSP